MRKLPLALALTFPGLLVAARPASAQLNSSESTASLTAVLPESLTVSLVPNSISFTLSSGSATNSGAVSISATTSWTLASSRTTLVLYGYFSSATAALAHSLPTNTVDIPSSRVEVSVNGGAAAAFDQTVAFGAAGAGRQLFSQPISVVTSNGSRTDVLAFNVNLGSYPMPADTYTGTLRIRAQATP